MSPVAASRRRLSPSRFFALLVANLVWLVPLFLAPATNAAGQISVTTLTDDPTTATAANCPGAACSLRDAILAANAAPGSTITFGVTGTYTLTGGASGFPAITQATTITGPGTGSLTIDGANTFPAFVITAGATMTVSISGLTIANTANGFPPFNFGSGIFINQPTAGAVTVNVDTVVFSNNNDGNTTQTGGGPAITSDATTTTSVILNVSNSTFVGNSTLGPGGAIWNAGTLNVSRSTFQSNTAHTLGSAIYNFNGGNVTVTNSTFANNTSNDGAIYNASGSIGPPPVPAGIASVFNSTFSGNVSTVSPFEGGSIANGGTLTIGNNIFVEPSTGFINQCAGTGCPTAIVDGDANGNFDDTNANLGLSALGNHGGPTLTFVPQTGASKTPICGGVAADYPGGKATGADQRGFAGGNPSCSSTQVDAGSVQLHPLVVTTTTDSEDGACTTALCSLRDAIDAANASGVGDISFKSGVTGTINLSVKEGCTPQSLGTTFQIVTLCISNTATNPSVTITGPGAGLLTINSTGADRIFFVDHSGSLTLSGVTLQNGGDSNPLSFDVNPGGGGAILNANSLKVDNVIFSGNKTTGAGGAIDNTVASATISNSWFTGNTAGGNGGAIESSGPLTVTTSTFSGNTSGNNGSAIDHSTNSLYTISYSTFSGNNAGGGGAVDVLSGDTLTVTNSTFANNTDTGGSDTGIYPDGGTLNVTNTLLGEATECDANAPCPLSGGGNVVAPTNLNTGYVGLSDLRSYGGPTPTILPLPGSSAICGGLKANIPSGVTTDQRGFSNTPPAGYACAGTAVDSGAVQTNYTAVAFNAASYAGSVNVGGSTPPMLVDFTESGNAIAVTPLSITTGGGAGAPTAGTTATTTATSGGFTGASFNNLTFGATGTATVAENLTVVGADVITTGPFNFVIGAGGTTATATTEVTPSPNLWVTSGASTNVTLRANVTSTSTVNEGFVTFKVCSNATCTGTVFGTPVGPIAVSAGTTGNVTYVVPSEPAGSYFAVAFYTDPGGASGFASSSGSSGITINPVLAAAQATASPNNFTVSAGVAVTPFTPVTASGGIPPYTFTIVGPPTLPGTLAITATGGTAGQITGTAPTTTGLTGPYTVKVTDSETSPATATNTFELTVNASATVTTASSLAATYNAASQNVTLNATVTSTAGTVNEGVVTFTLMKGASVIGTPVNSGTVTNGVASVTYVVPAGTAVGSYTIQAAYNDTGGKFANSSDAAHTLTINAAAVTVAAANQTAPFSATNQNVTLSAAVTSTAGTVAEGTVTFTLFKGATQVGTPVISGTVAAGAASVTYVVPGGTAAGSYTIQAVFNDTTPGNFSAGTDSAHTLTISGATTTVTAANATATYNAAAQNVTLSATVTSTGGTVNEGAVTFTVFKGVTQVGTAVTSGTVTAGAASAIFAIPAGTAGGSYTIQAVYNDAANNFATGTDTSHTLTINAATSVTAASNAVATYKSTTQNVTLAATVTSAAGPVNEGTVTFTVFDGATQVGTAVTSGTVAAGAASAVFTIPAGQAPKAYSIHATYNGTSSFLTSADTTHTLTISPAAVTVAASNASINFNTATQNVTLNATVTSTAGTVGEGTVTFTILKGATVVGTATTSGTVAAGAASVSYALPAGQAAGSYTIQAVFNDTTPGNYSTGSDSTHTLTINGAATTVAAANATTTYSGAAQNVTLSATVTSAAGTVNEGAVTFTLMKGATVVGTAVTSGTVTAGAASVTYIVPAGTAAGSYTIQAVYNDAASNFATGTDTSHTLTINAAGATVAAANATTTYSGTAQNVTLSAAVTSTAGTVSEGTVTFTILSGATVIGTATTSGTVAAGAASVSYALPAGQAAGPYTIRAVYNDAGGSFNTSTDTSHTLTISAAGATVAAANATTAYSATAQNVTLTATVTSTAGAVSQGTVTFTVMKGATVIGAATTSGTVTAGAASVSYAIPAGQAPGSYTIQAVYNDVGGSFNSSTDTTHTLTIGQSATTTTAANATTPFSGSAQNVTLTATVTSTGGTVSEGTVTFTVMKGATVIGAATTSGTVASGAASVSYAIPAGQAAGSYTIQAVYNDAGGNFATSTDTTHTLTVGQVTPTLAAANITTTYNSAAQNVTLTAALTSTAGAVNEGTVTFTVMQGATVIGAATTSATVAAGAASVSYALPAGQAAGSYTIQAVYNDAGGSFNTASDSTHTLTIGTATPTINWANPAAITYGTSLAGVLNATATFGSGSVAGTFSYTATPAGGSATPVTAATVLAAGSYTLTASFTPTSSNFGTPTPKSVPLTVNQAQPTLAWTPTGTIAYGTSLNGLLNAAASFGANAVAGSYAYTATLSGGTAVPVTDATVLANGSYTLGVTFTPTDTTDYKTATATAPLIVTSQSLTVSANNATKVYGTANPAFTGTVTGAVNGDTFTESFTTTATTTSNVGTYPIVPSVTGANLANYVVVINDGTLTVTQAGSTVTLTASSNSINPGSSVTLTAAVASATTGTPTGTVSFYDGSTLLGTGTLAVGANGDVATFATSSLLSGSHTITAVYSGDANFTAGSTTSSITITVAPLGLTLSANPSSQTGLPGTTFTYNLAVAPAFAGTPYPGTVTFAANGGPVGAVITFTPSSLAAGAGPQTVAMSVATSTSSAALQPLSTGRRLVPLTLALFLLPLAGTRRMRRNGKRMGKLLCLLVLALAGIAGTTALTGCGTSTGGTQTVNKGTQYTITVTATSGSAAQNTTVTLTLQ